MADSNSKQLVAEQIKQSTNILITVEKDPSVDELASAIALTLMLNKLDKHPTAVFSGAIPPAINFLKPDKTFEENIDSLRDFIIALDKEKADRLRYKVEDDVVKIFITPYRSKINENDLEFSQGDFNIELIIALGVEQRESLDKAITAHGRILHDATVITINADDNGSSLGSIDWHDGSASSISEMLSGLPDMLQSNLFDDQVSTALLTGVVAATERFSNKKTSSQTMSIAAQLMGAGANQQLIATNLQQTIQPKEEEQPPKVEEVDHVSPKLRRDESFKTVPEAEETGRGEIKVAHENARPKPEASAPEPVLAPAAPKEEVVEPKVEAEAPKEEKQETEAEAKPELVVPNRAEVQPTERSSQIQPIGNALRDQKSDWQTLTPPSLGGTFNATSAEAEDAKRRQAEESRNQMMLSHDEAKEQQAKEASREPIGQPAGTSSPAETSLENKAPAPTPAAPTPTSTAPVSNEARDLDAARQAVSEALTSPSTQSPVQPEVTQQPTAPVSSEEAQPQPAPSPQATPSPAPAPTPAPQPQPTQNELPPLPDFENLPPLPPITNQPQAPTGPQSNNLPPANQPQVPFKPAPGQIAPSDPNDLDTFKIPGQ